MTELIIGPMFSGKSTLMMSRLERATIAKKNVLLIRPETDTRKYILHSGDKKLKIDSIGTKELLLLSDDFISSYDVIGIDEGQFFDDIGLFIKKYHTKKIYISALNATSEQTMFKPIIKAIPFCEIITKLNAVCMWCGNDTANFVIYKGKEKSGDILVGDEGDYETICADCFYENA